jgi:hypothetical protein
MGKGKQPLHFDKRVQRDSVLGVTDKLSDLDLLAITIHRLYWVGEPKLVNNGTVAVAEVDGEIWYAVNVLTAPTHDEVVVAHSFVSRCNVDITPYLIHLDEGEGDDQNTHAEMKLLYQLEQEGKKPANNHIGVSKPACQYCYATLKKNEIGVSWYHTRQVVTWDYPKIDESKLVRFEESFK